MFNEFGTGSVEDLVRFNGFGQKMTPAAIIDFYNPQVRINPGRPADILIEIRLV